MALEKSHMAYKFPSETKELLKSWKDKINQNEQYQEAASGWGVDFNGDILFTIREGANYDGDPINILLELEDGNCFSARKVDPGDVEYGVEFTTSYTEWKNFLQETHIAKGYFENVLDFSGDESIIEDYLLAKYQLAMSLNNVGIKFEY